MITCPKCESKNVRRRIRESRDKSGYTYYIMCFDCHYYTHEYYSTFKDCHDVRGAALDEWRRG